MNRENFCRAVDPGSQQLCDCEDFYPRHEDEGHCAECGHGRSKHPNRNQKTVLLDAEHSETPQDDEASQRSSGTAAMKEIFNRVTAKSSTSKRGGSSISVKAAREEALTTLSSTRLANYNKLSKGPGPSTGLQKARRDTTSLQPTGSQVKRNTIVSASGTSFRVASVAMLICGVDRHGAIRVSKAPTKNGMNEIQAMKNRGCYVDEQVSFYHDWPYSRITQLLRKLFPKVFDYLDLDRHRSVSSSQSVGQEEKPIWRLLNKSGQVLTVVDIACPTGTDLAKHKGREKASVTECHLWFVTRNRIPDTVYESWNTQPIVAGSDSEGDCNGSEVELFSDVDSIGDDVDDHNPELASSLMEMELSDSGDNHDRKGKGVLRTIETPKIAMGNAKRTRTALSPNDSPANQRVAAKRLKSETATAIPRFLPLQSSPSLISQLNVPATYPSPELSRPATVVSVSEDDVLWRNQPQPDDPFAPAMINPWEPGYVVKPVDYLI
ncbi:hypothetical protein BD769DRAFT_1669082 [Suillus cothurnatus]|nr:hypothetical protein BD769DRAFT_1669082 [Suillus cothurnatus]